MCINGVNKVFTLLFFTCKAMSICTGLKVWLVSNCVQQHATTSNNMQRGMQTDATCTIQQCCLCLHYFLRNNFNVIYFLYFLVNFFSCSYWKAPRGVTIKVLHVSFDWTCSTVRAYSGIFHRGDPILCTVSTYLNLYVHFQWSFLENHTQEKAKSKLHHRHINSIPNLPHTYTVAAILQLYILQRKWLKNNNNITTLTVFNVLFPCFLKNNVAPSSHHFHGLQSHWPMSTGIALLLYN